MKKLFVLLLITGFLFPNFITAQKWDKKVMRTATAYIESKGIQFGPKAEDRKFVLPDGGLILLQGQNDEPFLTVSTDTLNFSIFIEEKKNYKKNLFNYKYASTYSQKEQKYLTSKVDSFWKNFVSRKPVSPVALENGTDSLTRAYLRWDSLYKTIAIKNPWGWTYKKENTDDNHYSLSIVVEKFERMIKIHYYFYSFVVKTGKDVESEEFYFTLDPGRPLLTGSCTDACGNVKPLEASLKRLLLR